MMHRMSTSVGTVSRCRGDVDIDEECLRVDSFEINDDGDDGGEDAKDILARKHSLAKTHRHQ